MPHTRKHMDRVTAQPNFFNLSGTFRRDASFHLPFGHYVKNYDGVTDFHSILSQKEKLVVWFVSHCDTDSHREEYVAELRKYNIPIDVFGRCSRPRACSKRITQNCVNVNISQYKFYLAAENSICKDYVTGKNFKIWWVWPFITGDCINHFSCFFVLCWSSQVFKSGVFFSFICGMGCDFRSAVMISLFQTQLLILGPECWKWPWKTPR